MGGGAGHGGVQQGLERIEFFRGFTHRTMLSRTGPHSFVRRLHGQRSLDPVPGFRPRLDGAVPTTATELEADATARDRGPSELAGDYQRPLM